MAVQIEDSPVGWAVEYTDVISAERFDPLLPKSALI